MKFVTENCIYGTHTTHLFHNSTATETDPLEHVYIDIWGPTSTLLAGGSKYFMLIVDGACQEHVERKRSDPEWSGITPEWKRVDNKSGGTTLALAYALCLDLLSCMWLYISGELNCCQESWRGVV